MRKKPKDWNNPDGEKLHGFCQECGADRKLCSCLASYDHIPDDDDDLREDKERAPIQPLLR